MVKWPMHVEEEAVSVSMVLELVEAGSALDAGITRSIWRPATEHTLKNTLFSPLRVAEKVGEDMLNDTIEQMSHRETMSWALKEKLLHESWREGTPGPGPDDAVSMLPFWTITGYCSHMLMSVSWRIAIRLYFPFFSSGIPSVSATDYPSSSSSSLSWTVRTLSFEFPSLVHERHHQCRSGAQLKSQKRSRNILWLSSFLLQLRPTKKRKFHKYCLMHKTFIDMRTLQYI